MSQKSFNKIFLGTPCNLAFPLAHDYAEFWMRAKHTLPDQMQQPQNKQGKIVKEVDFFAFGYINKISHRGNSILIFRVALEAI